MWIAAKSNPYYNTVEEFDTPEEAMAQSDEWYAELNKDDGEHHCKIYVCEVLICADMKTYY